LEQQLLYAIMIGIPGFARSNIGHPVPRSPILVLTQYSDRDPTTFRRAS
jgi:hypothetical protein